MASEQNGAGAFEQLVGELDYPMFIATTTVNGERAGCLLEPIAAHSGTPLDEFTFHRARRMKPGHEA